MTSLKVNLAGIKMSNPTMLASGMMEKATGAFVHPAADQGPARWLPNRSVQSRGIGYKNPTIFV